MDFKIPPLWTLLLYSGEDEAKIEAEESLKAKIEAEESLKAFKAESQSRKKFDFDGVSAGVSSLKSLNRKREKLLKTQATKKKFVKKSLVKPVEKSINIKSSKILQNSLSLSESSSSEDESDPKSQKVPTPKFTKIKSKPISSEKKQTKPVLEGVQFYTGHF